MHFIIISLILSLYATNLLRSYKEEEADHVIIFAAIKRRNTRLYLDADYKASNLIYLFFFIQVVRLDCLPRVGKVAITCWHGFTGQSP